MLFNSLAFLVFFPIVCLFYYLLPSLKARNLFLLGASYYFYMNWEPAYALLLLSSTFVTYWAGLGIERSRTPRAKKTFLTSSIVINLSILFIFKYFNFTAESLTVLLDTLNLSLQMPKFKLLLPVGISFYIFQALGYAIDVYRGETAAEKNFFTYALFVSFFPQLVAGPIERSTRLLPQFKEKQAFLYDNLMTGLRMMVWGYFLKLVLADHCALYVDAIFNNYTYHNGGSFLLASLLFTFQIYGDFAGYSLIAIGAAKIMGFSLMENFKRPYFATTISDFWHRWHISLSTWFKDYVYISLGGNRVRSPRQYFNLLITFALSGIWHGANWTFVAWGLLHGLWLCLEKGLGWHKTQWKGGRKLLHWILTFGLVCLFWIFFRAASIGEAGHIIRGIFTDFGMPYIRPTVFLGLFFAFCILIAKDITEEFALNIHIADSPHWLVRHLYLIFMTAFILLFGVLDGSQFIYFQF